MKDTVEYKTKFMGEADSQQNNQELFTLRSISLGYDEE